MKTLSLVALFLVALIGAGGDATGANDAKTSKRAVRGKAAPPLAPGLTTIDQPGLTQHRWTRASGKMTIHSFRKAEDNPFIASTAARGLPLMDRSFHYYFFYGVRNIADNLTGGALPLAVRAP